MKKPRKSEEPEITAGCGPEEIRSAVVDLSSRDKQKRMQGHARIVSAGGEGARCLVDGMASSSELMRLEVIRILDEMNINWRRHADDATVNALVKDLGSRDGLVRTRARRALVAIGAKAVPALEKALKSADGWTRWEAAKSLGQVRIPKAVSALIDALEDERFDVRYLAAEGLAAIGRPALVSLIRELAGKADSVWFREGAHHALREVCAGKLEGPLLPVCNALEDPEPELQVPIAAAAALRQLDPGPGSGRCVSGVRG